MINLDVRLLAVNTAEKAVIRKTKQVFIPAAFVTNPAQTRGVEAIAELIVVWRWRLAYQLRHESRRIGRAAIGIPWAAGNHGV